MYRFPSLLVYVLVCVVGVSVLLLSPQAMFDASELITQREIVSQRVNELLQERAESFHLVLDDISIVSARVLYLSICICVSPCVGSSKAPLGLYIVLAPLQLQ